MRGVSRARIRWLQRLSVLPFLVLCGRLVAVQVFAHDDYTRMAEAQWQHREVLPAERGNLYDRNGRALALSMTTWRIGLATCNVEDPDSAAAHVARYLDVDAGRLAARIKRESPGHFVIERNAVVHQDALTRLTSHKAVTSEELRTRAYPLGGVGASLLGFCREPAGGERLATGLEQALDPILAGEPGEGYVYDNVTGGSDGLKELVRPRDGDDVVLTLDADLQALAEDCLAEEVRACHASGGAVVIVQPSTGEILAAADTPVLAGRGDARGFEVWDNACFTGAYEPGSVMKIFTSASLLGRGVIDTTTAFDCDDIQFDGYRIRNSEGHDFGVMSFTGAFAHSSNVYFARAVLNLRRSEFYRDLVEFGFGAPYALEYPGKTRGRLSAPESWSGRSQSTIAIGQEITCTPVQLAVAASAVANGGVLMAPRLVREIRTKDGACVERFEPVPLRRVMTPELAALLRDVMADVVRAGTGVNAQVAWTEVAGKTGTAQKARPGEGYVDGLYMSSFVGMAPASAPRLVIVTMIDEPDYRHHYASQSAAPLFARLVEEIGRTTDWFAGVDARAGAMAVVPHPGAARPTPDLLYLSAAAAHDEVERLDLALSGDLGEGLVVAQSPAAGTPWPAGGKIRVTLAPAGDRGTAVGTACPDLTGFSSRQVRRLAARLGLDLRMEGVGYVVAQTPSPGTRLDEAGLRVRMASRW